MATANPLGAAPGELKALGVGVSATGIVGRPTAIVLLAVALAAVGCSDQARQSTPAAAPQNMVPQRRLRLLGEESASLAAFERVKSLYESSAGTRIDIVRNDHAGVLAAIDGDSAGPEGSFDLLIVPHRMVGHLVATGYVQSLDVFLNDPTWSYSGPVDPQKDFLAV